MHQKYEVSTDIREVNTSRIFWRNILEGGTKFLLADVCTLEYLRTSMFSQFISFEGKLNRSNRQKKVLEENIPVFPPKKQQIHEDKQMCHDTESVAGPKKPFYVSHLTME